MHFCPRGISSCDLSEQWRDLLVRDHPEAAQEVTRCAECGIGITMPSLPDVAFLYADRTSDDFEPDNTRLMGFAKDIAFTTEARRVLSFVGRKPRTVVDVGCGDGRFTQAVAKVLGSSAQVVGIDFHDAAPAAIATDPNVGYAPFSRLHEFHGKVDLVLSRHSLEHTEDPIKTLTEMKDLLSPDGGIFIEVPNFSSPMFKVFGKYWVSWYLPYHRHHFSRSALAATVSAAGLEPARIGGYDRPSVGRSLQNWLRCDYNILLFLAGVILHPFQMAVGFVSGQRSELRMLARGPKANEASYERSFSESSSE